jgi:hypothetical protein
MDIHRVRTFADFELIEIVDDNVPYPTLLGIDWDFNNSTVPDLNKRQMTFERDGIRLIAQNLWIQMKVSDTQNLSKKKTMHMNWKTYTN